MIKVNQTNIVFYCPGCDDIHVINISPIILPCWQYNNNIDSPTITPSILVTCDWESELGLTTEICHCFITNGNIQYLNDCTHNLAGKTIKIVRE